MMHLRRATNWYFHPKPRSLDHRTVRTNGVSLLRHCDTFIGINTLQFLRRVIGHRQYALEADDQRSIDFRDDTKRWGSCQEECLSCIYLMPHRASPPQGPPALSRFLCQPSLLWLVKLSMKLYRESTSVGGKRSISERPIRSMFKSNSNNPKGMYETHNTKDMRRMERRPSLHCRFLRGVLEPFHRLLWKLLMNWRSSCYTAIRPCGSSSFHRNYTLGPFSIPPSKLGVLDIPD